MPAMILTQKQATILGGAIGTVTSLASFYAASHLSPEKVLLFGGGAPVLGGAAYAFFNEYTPEQIQKRTTDTENEMMDSRIGSLFSNLNQDITLQDIIGIPSSNRPRHDVREDAIKYGIALKVSCSLVKKSRTK